MLNEGCNLLLIFCASTCLHLVSYIAATEIPALPGLNCTIKEKTVVVTLNWPYETNCDEHVNDDLSYDDELQCLIFTDETHVVLYNKTSYIYYEWDDEPHLNIKEDVPRVFVAFVQTKLCIVYNVTLNHTVLEAHTCKEARTANLPVSLQLSAGRSTTLPCDDGTPGTSPVHLAEEKHNFTVEWLYNCSSSLPNGSVVRMVSDTFNELLIVSASQYSPGWYTCAIRYNGMTRYFIQYDVCIILQPYVPSSPTITCDDVIRVDVSNRPSVTIQCTGVFGTGAAVGTNLELITASWAKEGASTFGCASKLAVSPTDGDGHRCYHFIDNLYNNTCIRDPVVAEQRNRSDASMTFMFVLSNLQEADLGRWRIIIRTPKNENATGYILLEHDPTRVLRENALIIGLCVGLTTLVFIILGILYYFRFYVAVYTKRWFGSYVPDDRPYHIFYSYHFAQDDDSHARERAYKVIKQIRQELDHLGYRVYDEHRDGDAAGLRAENAIDRIRNSHRFLLILTEHYIKDDWRVFDLHQAFSEMIEARQKLIFVLVPGIKQYISQHAVDDENLKMVQRAIKLNHKMEWSEKKFNKRQFRLQMEYAMPKLRTGGRSATHENDYASESHLRRDGTEDNTGNAV